MLLSIFIAVFTHYLSRRACFDKVKNNYPEAKFYLEQYHEIYNLNSQCKDKPPPVVLQLRDKMIKYFELMKKRALSELRNYSSKSNYGTALNYYLKNYDGLTLFLTEPDVCIDNNSQERLLRNHVIGRKTWYGTHSKLGAKTAAILFSIIETCKLNNVNPREYLQTVTKDLLAGKEPYTPVDFIKSI